MISVCTRISAIWRRCCARICGATSFLVLAVVVALSCLIFSFRSDLLEPITNCLCGSLALQTEGNRNTISRFGFRECCCPCPTKTKATTMSWSTATAKMTATNTRAVTPICCSRSIVLVELIMNFSAVTDAADHEVTGSVLKCSPFSSKCLISTIDWLRAQSAAQWTAGGEDDRGARARRGTRRFDRRSIFVDSILIFRLV
jgi:hypothetical protein